MTPRQALLQEARTLQRDAERFFESVKGGTEWALIKMIDRLCNELEITVQAD